MNMLLLVVLMVVNTLISIWNAYSCGRYWTESKIIGGWTRVITWCGVVMSAVGFTWVVLVLLTFLSIVLKWLKPEQAEVMFQLGYLVLTIPLLLSGLGIWAHSLVMAYRKRSFGNIAVAGWNTFAQAHNTWRAASEAPNALRSVLKFFSGGKGGKDKGGALIILFVILALASGIITTALIVRWADRRVAIQVTGM